MNGYYQVVEVEAKMDMHRHTCQRLVAMDVDSGSGDV